MGRNSAMGNMDIAFFCWDTREGYSLLTSLLRLRKRQMIWPSAKRTELLTYRKAKCCNRVGGGHTKSVTEITAGVEVKFELYVVNRELSTD